MKTIGVLGGISPQATMDFEARIHAISQKLIPQLANSGYPPMVVYYYRNAPILIRDNGQPIFPSQVNPLFLDAAQKLGSVADFLVITANGPHLHQNEVEKASGRKVLSMIDLTLQEVKRQGWQRIGLLGLGEPVVYQIVLQQMGLAYETLSGDLRDRLDRAIIALMEGRTGPASTQIAQEAVESLRTKSVDGVILGCTEIPLLLKAAAADPDLINPVQLLAEAAVRYAIE